MSVKQTDVDDKVGLEGMQQPTIYFAAQHWLSRTSVRILSLWVCGSLLSSPWRLD